MPDGNVPLWREFVLIVMKSDSVYAAWIFWIAQLHALPTGWASPSTTWTRLPKQALACDPPTWRSTR